MKNIAHVGNLFENANTPEKNKKTIDEKTKFYEKTKMDRRTIKLIKKMVCNKLKSNVKVLEVRRSRRSRNNI